MKAPLQRLFSNGPVLTDGAWGTQLQQRGLAPGDFPDHWNLTHPERVAEVARAYVEAGSDIILTNTFGANRVRLAEANLQHEVAAINRQGVQISRAAAGQQAFVFASIGPSGKMLLSGEVSPDDLHLCFEEQATALAEAGADALVVETMSDLAEAQIAVECASRTGLPVVVSMVFDSGHAKDRTMMGDTPERVADALCACGADIIGFNCGQGIETVLPVLERLRKCTELPLWVKPNAGLPEITGGELKYRIGPEEFAQAARTLVEAGAKFIGGCCGTAPDFIKALRQELNQLPGSRISPSEPAYAPKVD